MGAQWLSGRVLDSKQRGHGFEPHRHHCVVSLSKNINLSPVLGQPRKTRPFITERLLIGRKESNQTNKSFFLHTTFEQFQAIKAFEHKYPLNHLTEEVFEGAGCFTLVVFMWLLVLCISSLWCHGLVFGLYF